ncbi:hypothetical protein IHQ68_07255 [Chelatococcus sambhunathii]|uniref:Uncharacterized protein n=1 Tax=Chelatococcus sambhunathii TaxID=363953 RepID=A0ABU1DE78_9HYPH|nr:hypothetical protein [Chelatococcus sambhunathii]MDR4306413.1 hypothetical protein [Chelatococcus sambhunathii]
MRRLAAALLAMVSATPALAADTPDRAWVENLSRPTQCAELDNVVLTFANPKVRRFRIEASAPVYLPDLKFDATKPDFENCESPKPEPAFRFKPRTLTLYEDADVRLDGVTLATSWRERGAEVMVGDKSFGGLHQLRWMQRVRGAFTEILVADLVGGSWRVKPVPGEAFPDAAYGAAVLVGPVEGGERPMVDVARLKVDPATRAFRMTFAKGGVGEVRIAGVDEKKTVLDVSLDGLSETDPPRPFAALRSMFVSPTKADIARVNWRTEKGLYNEPVLDFQGANVSEARFDRIERSSHNTSAPDITFRDFAPAAPAR